MLAVEKDKAQKAGVGTCRRGQGSDSSRRLRDTDGCAKAGSNCEAAARNMNVRTFVS